MHLYCYPLPSLFCSFSLRSLQITVNKPVHYFQTAFFANLETDIHFILFQKKKEGMPQQRRLDSWLLYILSEKPETHYIQTRENYSSEKREMRD